MGPGVGEQGGWLGCQIHKSTYMYTYMYYYTYIYIYIHVYIDSMYINYYM